MPGTPFLSWAKPHILDFLGDKDLRIAFIPDAVVTMELNKYTETVAAIFGKHGHQVVSIHNHPQPNSLLQESDVCMVSGGNSFKLLDRLYELDLVDLIRERVNNGMKYVGWSAGSNVACPTIMTTNDMPIVQPPSFNALNLIPYQINPHYTEKTIDGHGGESREQRIMEYLELNQDAVVLGMREGCGLLINEYEQRFIGTGGTIFQFNTAPIQFLEESLEMN
jgi:dipeptidase E